MTYNPDTLAALVRLGLAVDTDDSDDPLPVGDTLPMPGTVPDEA